MASRIVDEIVGKMVEEQNGVKLFLALMYVSSSLCVYGSFVLVFRLQATKPG